MISEVEEKSILSRLWAIFELKRRETDVAKISLLCKVGNNESQLQRFWSHKVPYFTLNCQIRDFSETSYSDQNSKEKKPFYDGTVT